MIIPACKPAAVLLFSVFTVFCSTVVSAQSWAPVGNLGSVTRFVDEMNMALSPAGVPYVIYSDGNTAYQATVMTYSAGSWVAVGDTDFSPAAARGASVAIDGSGTPYVIFDNYSLHTAGYQSDSIVTVMKYNGSSWAVADTFYPAVLTGGRRVIAIDPAGMPYVVYQDPANDSGITVMKYTGAAWQAVGAPGFSPHAQFVNIMIGGDGVPYVAYCDSAGRIAVKTFNGTDWVSAGEDTVSGAGRYSLSANVGQNGVPYVAYYEGYTTVVKKYNGTAWVSVDSASLPANEAYTDIAIDKSGTPYIGFADSAFLFARVMKYAGGHWVNAGNTDFSAARISYPTMAVDSSGVPYIGYERGVTYTAAVMNLRDATGVSNVAAAARPALTIFPNPNQGSFVVKLQCPGNGSYPVTVTNSVGEKVEEFSIPANTAAQVQLHVPPGAYFLTVAQGNEQLCGKVVVE